jgi:hypothetical protein
MNEYVVQLAVKLGLADPRVVVADTTAQEAAIPYPSEVGLLTSFVRSVSTMVNTAGHKLKRLFGAAMGGWVGIGVGAWTQANTQVVIPIIEPTLVFVNGELLVPRR